ncbi:hypothetical protein NL108_016176 [Boleophthalmus pectinirostris]|nr:hypothetical protein NL108_016176 [Boleophthalmus pectinirostris]
MMSSLLLLLLGVSLSSADLKVFNLYGDNVAPSGDLRPDCYIKVFLDSTSLGQTSMIKDNKNPVWSDQFHYFDAQEYQQLRLEVWDRDLNFDDGLGICRTEIRVGTYKQSCYMTRGGLVHYTYTLS